MDKSKLKSAILMIVSLAVIPTLAVMFDKGLTPLQMEILKKLLWMYGGITAATFIISEITRNCSQVDKIWSLKPIAYAWTAAYMGGMDTRLIIMALLVTFWGLRLTYNFARRGGYSWKFWSGEEDYRWAVLRKDPAFNNPIKWFFFNLFFISIYQNAVILLFTMPILLAVDPSNSSLNAIDYICIVGIISLIIWETVADQQQWNYQTEKYRKIKAKEPLNPEEAQGFISSGLWGVSRHPNYFAEQSIWVVFYFFSVAATDRWLNWTAIGFILILVLFQGSVDFSEGISASKYPKYKDYQNKVSKFLPFLKF